MMTVYRGFCLTRLIFPRNHRLLMRFLIVNFSNRQVVRCKDAFYRFQFVRDSCFWILQDIDITVFKFVRECPAVSETVIKKIEKKKSHVKIAAAGKYAGALADVMQRIGIQEMAEDRNGNDQCD